MSNSTDPKIHINNTSLKTSVWWIRRDLRLRDNQALSAALHTCNHVLPLFILDPGLIQSEWNCEKRMGFLFACLRELDKELQKRGARLIIRRGKPEVELANIVTQIQAGMVFAERDYSPYACQRDRLVKNKIPLTLTTGLMLHQPEEVVKPDGSPYTVFTPFSRAWQKADVQGKILPTPDYIPMVDGITGEPVPDSPEHVLAQLFPAGEDEGQRRLKSFTNGKIDLYHEQRDRIDLDGTSALSPYLRFGLISMSQAILAARESIDRENMSDSARGAETWLNELTWREFYFSILYHFPYVRERAFREKFTAIPWRNNPEDFTCWKEGKTGYPVVDAAMRQLQETGWMHNRSRMITASFLTKDLLIDWRWGEKWFMQNLLDGDPSANNGGWQWTAGTGTDAAPYFRIFNPILQALKFDPKGEYIRRWIPELSRVPDVFIHQPWKMNPQQQRETGCFLGRDYPFPIVDHGTARQRALQAYAQKERFYGGS